MLLRTTQYSSVTVLFPVSNICITSQALEQAAQGGGWVTTPGGVQKMCRCNTGIWFSRPGGVGLTVGLDDFRGLSNLGFYKRIHL